MNDKEAMNGTELGEKLLQSVHEMKAGKVARTFKNGVMAAEQPLTVVSAASAEPTVGIVFAPHCE